MAKFDIVSTKKVTRDELAKNINKFSKDPHFLADAEYEIISDGFVIVNLMLEFKNRETGKMEERPEDRVGVVIKTPAKPEGEFVSISQFKDKEREDRNGEVVKTEEIGNHCKTDLEVLDKVVLAKGDKIKWKVVTYFNFYNKKTPMGVFVKC